MKHDRDGGREGTRQLLEERLERFDPAGGRADDDNVPRHPLLVDQEDPPGSQAKGLSSSITRRSVPA